MAEIQVTKLVDDLTGNELSADDMHRIFFTVDGKDYRLDVSEEGKDQFEGALERFISSATKVSSTHRKRRSGLPSATPRGDGVQTKMREWARANGYEVAERGRIPSTIQDAYNAAN